MYKLHFLLGNKIFESLNLHCVNRIATLYYLVSLCIKHFIENFEMSNYFLILFVKLVDCDQFHKQY